MKRNKRIPDGVTEWRCYGGQEFRTEETDNGKKTIEGHPAVYNRSTDMGWFTEIIEPGAFDNTDMTDVPLLVNHDMRRIPLARSRRNNGNSTMTLTTDATGLQMRAEVDTEGNQEARQLYSAVQRGDMDGMSFSFNVRSQEWTDLDSDHPTRHIKEVAKLFEVSAVNWPAYKDTDIQARAKSDALDSAKQVLDNARAAALESAESRSAEAEEVEKMKIRNRILGGR